MELSIQSISRGIVICAVLTSVSACNSSNSFQFPEPNVAAFDDRVDTAIDLSATANGSDYTLEADLPTTGSANYEGYIALVDANQTAAGNGEIPLVVGDLHVDVNFGSNDTSSRADNFIDENGEYYDGSLRGSGEVMVLGLDGVTRGELGGTLRDASGGTISYDLVASGDFLGPNGELLDVGYIGEASVGSQTIDVSGRGVAELQ
ncbi:hypothetical protein [Aestuariibius sp. HNIBRBA575]|uniref:hypothetical protein n=1 Tax=Aestuariibius sp. HNIBRBA575 TaxID=3233343 RepID=UPI0034A2BD8D